LALASVGPDDDDDVADLLALSTMSSSGYVRSMIGRKAPLSRRDRRCSRISGVSIGRGKTTLRRDRRPTRVANGSATFWANGPRSDET
jgi:hypothetical protein